MRRSSRRPDPVTAGITEPNMTPLIDVSLVLVVILMVATPLALQSGLGVSRAATSGAAAPRARVQRVEIEIVTADSVVVDRVGMPRTRLRAALAPRLMASATREVVVRCGDTVPHGAFVAVLDEAKSEGAAAIAVAGR
jgi:biopolymer transport protein ExbD